MAVIFPSSAIQEFGNKINIRNHVVQFVDGTVNVNTTVGTGAWVEIINQSIYTTKDYNPILVEYMCNHRNDSAKGTWSLTYHRMLVTCPEAGIYDAQIMYGGHMGAAAQHIGYYERQFMFYGGVRGTYTFKASVLAYAGTSWIGAYNSGSTNHYLRLYEIGT